MPPSNMSLTDINDFNYRKKKSLEGEIDIATSRYRLEQSNHNIVAFPLPRRKAIISHANDGLPSTTSSILS